MTLATLAAGLFGAALLATAVGAAPNRAPADPFVSCRERLTAAPAEYDSAYCFYAAAVAARNWDAGARVLETLIRAHPDNFWLPLALGHLHRNRQPSNPDAADMSYRRAADGFQAAGHFEGEILARTNLRDMLLPMGRVDDASAEVARVAAIGATADDPMLQARAWSLEAAHLFDTGGDLGMAYRLLKRSERAILPDGPYRLRRALLNSLGRVAFRLGRLDEALMHFRRLTEQARAENDLQAQAAAQYNVLNTESMRESMLPTAGAKERLLRLARQTLEIGLAAPHTHVTLKAHRVVGALLANVPGSRGEAVEHVERCLALAAEARQQQDEAACAWLIATLLHDTSPRRAREARVRAVRATARANTAVAGALNAGRQMEFSWLTRPRVDAIRESLDALDALETMRTLQEGSVSSAEVFSTWTFDYYWLSGRLLLDGDGDLDLAFSIAERLRARTLLEGRSRDTGRQLARPTRGARVEAAFATLTDVQSALGPDEALLSFQLGIWDTIESTFGGGGWLTVATRDRRAVYRIPDRAHFAPLVPLFTGLLAGGDGREIAAAVRLHNDVFSSALRELPPAITRLILVPDGPIQHLPFDALRASAGAEPLAARYEIVVSPSATWWIDTRKREPLLSNRRVLVLADPELDVTNVVNSPDRPAGLLNVTLGRLPYARRESRALTRYLVGVDALVGPAASEHAIKTRALGQYELMHFAAHAVADEARPERSAVFLAPGDAGQDGLLQAHEIEELDLDGIVVLSACRTASGAVLSGEGVLSLARAFFRAGARAVIGTRWPIRDEAAASMFETFYRVLREGETLSGALARTKAEAIAQGRRPEVWAGLVLLGDGAIRPFPPRIPTSGNDGPMFAGLVLLAATIIVAGALAGSSALQVR